MAGPDGDLWTGMGEGRAKERKGGEIHRHDHRENPPPGGHYQDENPNPHSLPNHHQASTPSSPRQTNKNILFRGVRGVK